jgi:hypothetical protein
VSCDIGNLAPGANAAVAVIVRPGSAGQLLNSVTVSGGQLDLNPANNSATAMTSVLQPPVILNAPQNQTVTNGGTLILTVNAGGTAPLSHQWQFNDADIPGENDATLTRANVAVTARGNYRVRVANDVGAVTSAAASVRVLVPSQIVSVSRAGSITTISFATEIDLTYVLEYKDTVNPGAWNTLNPVGGTGTVKSVQDNSAGAPSRIYRVRVE